MNLETDTTFFSDGHVGLSIERHDASIRLLEKPAGEGKPSYRASGYVNKWRPTVCMISALSGVVVYRHQVLIAEALYQTGFRWLFLERSDEKLLASTPVFKLYPMPPFDDLLYCDLGKTLDRVRKKSPKERVFMQKEGTL